MSIPKIDITAPDESHAVAPARRDPNLTMPGPDQWPAGVMACLKCEIIYDRGAGMRQRASFLTSGEREPVAMERSVEAAPEVGRFMYGPWHKEGGAESLAAGGEAKSERRGWVDAGGMTTPSGTWVRNFHERIPSLTDECRTWVDGAEIWTGCPNPHCTREEPHEIGIVECRMPPSAMVPGVSMEVVYADPSVPQVTKPEDVDALGMGGTETGEAAKALVRKRAKSVVFKVEVGKGGAGGGPRKAPALRDVDTAIPSETALAHALFIESMWDVLVARAELDDPCFGPPTLEKNADEFAPRIGRVFAVAWNDPAYAKERQAAERLASRTWSARRVGR